MSYALGAKCSLVLAALLAFPAGCTFSASTGVEDGATGTSQAALGEAATLTFGANFQVQVSGALEKGKTVRVAYDASRLTACRGDFNGKPGWSITGYYKIGSGDVRTFEAGGFSPSNGGAPPVLTLDASGDLQIWFQNSNRWGCSAYDSDFGNNYRFAVQPAANEPGWLGNVRAVTSRRTCNGGPCDGDMRAVDGDLLFDTWTRQRAAIKAIYFEAWKQGVTDFDNADLWKQLDVRLHRRVGSSGPFATTYVGFDRRIGNNARYAVDLGALDPIDGRITITKPSECPPFLITALPDNGGQYVEAVVELYFTVNGVELRPAPGAAYRVRYQNYRSSYALCAK
jgi:hypothetical protein